MNKLTVVSVAVFLSAQPILAALMPVALEMDRGKPGEAKPLG